MRVLCVMKKTIMYAILMVAATTVLIAHVAVAATPDLSLDVKASGKFTVRVSGAFTFHGAPPQIDGIVLAAQGSATTHGTDSLGKFSAQTLSWADAKQADSPQSSPVLKTTFKTYPGDTGVIVFEQSFPQGLGKSTAHTSSLGSARTLFPSFVRNANDSSSSQFDDLDCFAYHGVFPAMQSTKVASYKESHQGGSPLVIYDASKTFLPMVVFSPIDKPKAQHFTSGGAFIGAGVKTTVDVIPAGHTQRFMLSAGEGINAGMQLWGDRVLKFLKVDRVDNRYRDLTHSSIGFWTDNGGFYHYSIGANKSLGSNYEEVLTAVKEHHDDIGIPFRHWQFDSWFYPKDGGVNPGGGGGAVTNWTAMPSVFPHGMAYIQTKLNVPMVMHNRQWSIASDYIKHEPFKWYTSNKAAVPQDPEAFFIWFFTQQEGWGLTMYEQDWMCTEYDEVEELQTNLTLADSWLQGMAVGAASSNRTVQYCMPYPHDVLAAAALPAVTNARATGDYFHASHQWAIGSTALLYHAINILPFKDGFYSSNKAQTGGQTVGPELNPDREALMATLSTAMVGPMDGYGLLNVSRVMASCRSDGIILKPDRPVTTSDYCFRKASSTSKPEDCFVYQTWSAIGDQKTYYLYNDAGTLSPAMLGLEDNAPFVLYNWYTHSVSKFSGTMDVTPGYEGHSYGVVAPIMKGGFSFIGEVDKFTTVSSLRFSSITVTGADDTLEVKFSGAENEVVKVCATTVESLSLMCQTVKVTDKEMTVTFQNP